MKKWLAVALMLLVWTNVSFARQTAVHKKTAPGKHSTKAVHAKAVHGRGAVPSKQAVGPCQAYIVMEPVSGRVLEGENIHVKRAPASVTKLMVAYVVMEKLARGELKLTDKITATREASKIGGSQVYLKEGEEFTFEEMMKAMMIASANDAAYAIAEHISGTPQAFVRIMNEKAKFLGMNDTEFQSVHGLPPGKDQKEDQTSSYDLALLGRSLLGYSKLLEWTSMKDGEFRNGQFALHNHNKLLMRLPDVDGLKTGFYSATGFNIVVSAKRSGLRCIVVVMGSPSGKIRDDFAAEKIKNYFADYTPMVLVKKGEQIQQDVLLDDGKYRKLKGVAATEFVFPAAKSKKSDIKRSVSMPRSLKGEIREGQKLGELVFQVENEVVGKVDIVSPVYVPKANLFTRLVRKTGLNL
jgi:serine-type D-Ala-D-Ala carboxypeptidase (penicillin-binding protein 5/6)